MATDRLIDMLRAEREHPLTWYYLCFQDAHGRFVSGTIVRARGLAGATVIALEHGINPGGPVIGVALEPTCAVPPQLHYRLAPIDEISRIAPNLVPQPARTTS